MKSLPKIENLKTIKNYALSHNITPSYIYKLKSEGKIDTFSIDGVQFIDTVEYPKPRL